MLKIGNIYFIKSIKLQPEYKTLWKIYEFDMYKKKKITKKKKK